MELKFDYDMNSALRLDDILNSYPGRGRGTIMAEPASMTAMLYMLSRGMIVMSEHTYLYDSEIQDDSGIAEIYRKLERDTRWRRFEHTEMKQIRMNALRQMLGEGAPFFDQFICYRGGQVCVHCGNLELPGLLMYLASHERTEQFYVFTYPYWENERTASYYCFDIDFDGIAAAKAYRERVWDKLRESSADLDIFPRWPEREPYDHSLLNELTEEGLINAAGRTYPALITPEGENEAKHLLSQYRIVTDEGGCPHVEP